MTVTRSHYEVVLLGRTVTTVLAAALLARRGHRVLLLGQGDPAPWTTVSGYRLPRLVSGPLPLGAPHVDAPLEELALGPELQRRLEEPDPPLHVALPGRRLELWRDPADLARELAREFREVQRPLHDFARLAAEACASLERVLGREAHWPPRGWLARRRARAAFRGLPALAGHGGAHPLDEIPEGHPFRAAVTAAAHMVLSMPAWTAPPMLRTVGFGRWRHRARRFDGGLSSLLDRFEEKARAAGAELRFEERVECIEVRRGRLRAVRLSGSGERIGCDVGVSGVAPEALRAILPSEEAARIRPEGRSGGRRVLLVGLGDEALVPSAVVGDVVQVAGTGRPKLVGDLLHVRFEPGPSPGSRLLLAEAWVPERVLASERLRMSLRRELLNRIGQLVPFVERHLELVDSPHDGLPPWRWPGGEALAVQDPWSRGPRRAPALVVRSSPPDWFGIPRRTGVAGLLRCDAGAGVGLGLEEAFLAARAVADAVFTRG